MKLRSFQKPSEGIVGRDLRAAVAGPGYTWPGRGWPFPSTRPDWLTEP